MKIITQVSILFIFILYAQSIYCASIATPRTGNNKTILLKKRQFNLKNKKVYRKIMKPKKRKHPERLLVIGTIGLASIFAGLKLTGTILWPWFWILSPIWIPIGLFITIAIYVVLLFLLMPKQPKFEAMPEKKD